MFASCSIKTRRRPTKIDSAAVTAMQCKDRAEAGDHGRVGRRRERQALKTGPARAPTRGSCSPFASCSIKTRRRPTKIDSAAVIAVGLGGRAEAEDGGSVTRVHERATSNKGEEVMVSMGRTAVREVRYREMKSTLARRIRPRHSAWRAPPHR